MKVDELGAVGGRIGHAARRADDGEAGGEGRERLAVALAQEHVLGEQGCARRTRVTTRTGSRYAGSAPA